MVAGGDRDVELAGAGHELAVGGDHDRGVEAEAVVAVGALVQGGVDVDPPLLGEAGGERVGAPAGQLLGLGAARAGAGRVDGEVGAQGELLQADQPRALLGPHADAGGEGGLVLAGIGVPAVLEGGDPEGVSAGRPGPRGGARGPLRGDQSDLLHRR